MKLLTPALLAATALATSLPAVAQAQSYGARPAYQDCEASRQNRQIAGALIGGILGAVIGNELADDSNNNRHGRHDRWDNRRGHGRHGHYDRRYEHRDRGNAEEVGTIAGAGVGALIGAGIASGDDCGTVRQAGGKPGGYYGDEPYYGDSGYYGNDPYYGDDRYYESRSDDRYYDSYGSNGELLGGPQRAEPARTYTASSGYSGMATTGSCQWSQTRRMDEYGGTVTDRVWMCQGTDGIWRPADTYGR